MAARTGFKASREHLVNGTGKPLKTVMLYEMRAMLYEMVIVACGI